MVNIIVFRDSIAWGACDYEKGGRVDRLKIKLNPKDKDVYNCSISGNNTADVLKRFYSQT
jgi:hypothetical protein